MKSSFLPSSSPLRRRSTLCVGPCLGALLITLAFLPPFAALAQPTHATGTVEIGWKGKGGPNLEPGETKYAFASFAAFPPSEYLDARGQLKYQDPRGEFIYTVVNPDLTVHREIVVELLNVSTGIDPKDGFYRAWMAGVVVSDTKSCSGGSGDHSDGDDAGGGCDGGCSHDTGDTTHDDGCGGGGSEGDMGGGPPEGEGSEGGCSHDTGDTTHDDGCTGSDTGGSPTEMPPEGESPDSGSEGGCSHDTGDTTHDDGCGGGGSEGDMGGGPPEGEGSEGGCSHDSGDTTHDDGCGGSGGDMGGDKVSGKGSRVGQILFGKVKDCGTPGAGNDHITWKWFAAPADIDQLTYWMLLDLPSTDGEVKLCKKTILSGNLIVHER